MIITTSFATQPACETDVPAKVERSVLSKRGLSVECRWKLGDGRPVLRNALASGTLAEQMHLTHADNAAGEHMPIFIFQTIDARGDEPTEQIAECADINAAKLEGRRLLADLASDGLPENAMDMLSVEIFDSEKRPVIEYRLMFEEIAKS